MSDGNRFVLIALTGSAALLTTFGMGAYFTALEHPQEQRYQPYQYADDNIKHFDPANVVSTKSQPFKYREPCKEPKGRDESDLCAQWRAAKAGENSAFWAKWGFWVAIAGTIAVVVTLHYTRKAVLAAEDATQDAAMALEIAARNADAATKLVETAEKTAERQLRAYLAVNAVTLDESEWDEDCFQVMIELQNAGQTPANVRTVRLWALWAAQDGQITLIDHTSENDFRCHRDTPMHMPFSFKATFDELNEPGNLMVVGRVEYLDVFGKKRKERFGFQTPIGAAFFVAFHEHSLPLRLAAFSPLALIQKIEAEETQREQGTKSQQDQITH